MLRKRLLTHPSPLKGPSEGGPAYSLTRRGGRDARGAAEDFCVEADEVAKSLPAIAPDEPDFVCAMALDLLCGPYRKSCRQLWHSFTAVLVHPTKLQWCQSVHFGFVHLPRL